MENLLSILTGVNPAVERSYGVYAKEDGIQALPDKHTFRTSPDSKLLLSRNKGMITKPGPYL